MELSRQFPVHECPQSSPVPIKLPVMCQLPSCQMPRACCQSCQLPSCLCQVSEPSVPRVELLSVLTSSSLMNSSEISSSRTSNSLFIFRVGILLWILPFLHTTFLPYSRQTFFGFF